MSSMYECDSCGAKVNHDSAKRHIPFNWCNRNINDVIYLLCDVCGVDGPFSTSVPSTLKKRLSLTDNTD
jgi:DNA-directed RNA polymerase subunit RPC12/RpoP